MNIQAAAQQTALLSTTFSVYPVTAQIVLEAIRGVRDHQLSFWDAQIWAAARFNQVSFLFSEDFNPGAALEGVRFINPFTLDFNLDDWLDR